jgi:hypothetical protein
MGKDYLKACAILSLIHTFISGYWQSGNTQRQVLL